MRKITVTFFLTLLILCCFSAYRCAGEVDEMTDKFIRLHVLANSDSPADQKIKLDVRDGILDVTGEILSGSSDKAKAMDSLDSGLERITNAAKTVLAEKGCTQNVSCTLKKEYFGERVYDGFTLPAGEYDSLVVRIGEAKGKNWWCICYPEICVGAAVRLDESAILTDGELKILKDPESVKYKLWCYEALLKIKRLFIKR